MKFKFLLVLLLIPQFCSAYYVSVPCCSRFQLPGWWGSAEYIFWWRKERFYPPLATTNPSVPPILTAPGTSVLFGDEAVGGTPKSGGRGDFGFWLTRCVGFGTSFYALGKEEVNFGMGGSSAGIPILGQPFFNTSTGLEDVHLVSFPLLQVNGNIEIDATNRLWGFDLYTRLRFFCTPCFKFDLLGGFQYCTLVDNLSVNSHTTSILLESVTISDQFDCKNEFYGGLAGLVAEWRSSSWALVVTGKVGLGNMHEHIRIFGTTTTLIPPGPPSIAKVGLLAQPSNIGKHKTSPFEVISQINANLQLKINRHVWLTAGYSYLFWPAVALAGEQVNLNINPTQFPGPPIGPISPRFHEKNKSFWVQGITAGFYIFY